MNTEEYGRLSPSERELLRGAAMGLGSARKAPVFAPAAPVKPKAAPKPKGKSGRPRKPDPAAFDAVKFHQELRAVARSLDVKSMDTVAADTGVRVQTIHGMKKGLAPTLAECLLLCEWAGMNPVQYLLRLAPLAANDTEAREAA